MKIWKKIYCQYANHNRSIYGFNVDYLLGKYNDIYFKTGGNALFVNVEESELMVKVLLIDIKNEMAERFFKL